MLKNSFCSFLILLFIFSANSACASERDQWQQFRAHKGMQELDAEFAPPKPEPEVRVETRVIEKVIVKEVYVPAPAAAAVAAMPVPEPVAVSAPTPVADDAVTVESDGYVFKLSACRFTHGNIKCDLSILSPEHDGNLYIYGVSGGHSTRLFDRSGNEYHPSKVAMGNKSNRSSVRNRYVAGVTAKGSLHFENLDQSTKALSLLELALYNEESRKHNRIKFRNINLAMQ